MLCLPAFGQTTAVDWYNEGNTLYGQDKYDEAIKAYDKATEIDPSFEEAWYNKGLVLADQGKYDEAIISYDKAIGIIPYDAMAWNSKGVALDNKGKFDDAIQAYDKAIKIDPNYPIAWLNKGVALNALNKHNEAVKAYNKADQLALPAPRNLYHPPTLFLLGVSGDFLDRQVGNLPEYSEAFKCYERKTNDGRLTFCKSKNAIHINYCNTSNCWASM